MSIPEFSVRRRITITMLVLIITLFGVTSFSNLGLDLLPDLEFPFVSVVTTYSGVGPEEIETLITKPIEESVSTVKGIKKVTSVTAEGISSVYCEFQWGTNLDFAAQDVRDKLAWITDFLPQDADPPLVLKFNIADMPIIEYGVIGMENTKRLRDYLDDVVKPRLEQLEGVASVFIFGGKIREIQVLVDPQMLKATWTSLEQVLRGVQAGNLNIPGGHVETMGKEYLVRTTGNFESIDEIRNTIISISKDGGPVRVADVAVVEDTFTETRGYERTNSEPSVIIAIMKQSGFNTLQAVNRVKEELKSLEKTMPRDVSMHLILDQGRVIERSISATGSNALVGGIIAIGVVLIFLRSIRPTLTIAIAIPLSIITTFIGMSALGYTFNIMTLGGIALGVGLLVDNAVVVIENTFRHLEEGKPRHQAAVIGASEVGLAITASTLTTAAVFFPMSLSQSIAGKLARPLSLTVCISLLASLFVATTIIPAIAATIFKKEKSLYERIEGRGWTGWLRTRYSSFLEKVLRHRGLVILGAFVLFIASIFLATTLGREFMPKQDMPLAVVDLTLPEGAVLAETDHIARQVEAIFLSRDEVITCGSMVGITLGSKFATAQGGQSPGVNKARIFARFTDKEQRSKSSDAIINEIRNSFPALEGVDFRFEDLSGTLFGSGGSPIEVNIYGPDLDVLYTISEKTLANLASIEGLLDLDTSLKKSKPELQVSVDREKAAFLGLSVAQIGTTVETAMLGRVASRFHGAGEEYDIRVRFQEPFRRDLHAVRNIAIHSPLGFSVPLSQVASLEEMLGPITIIRKNQNRAVTVTGTNFHRDLGSISDDVQKALERLSLPEGYFYDIGGVYEDMQTSFNELSKALLIAIILIYMIMAAQFESLSQPLIVMFALPLGFVGVVVGLAVTGKSLSVPSFMGLIILMGIVVNNAIVMIDYINRLRREGLEKTQAIIAGASIRLRPILITSITTISAMLPMALSTGEGSEMRSPMAVAVAFGLLFAMVLTLVVIPSAYSLIESIASRIRRKTGEIVIGEDTPD
ncbi:MAG TPA: efflux RND transporter permease subunit [Deltaproteobacteria bacterium]|nr:efflux RND transporter permease subunit [Deltaproteobacteria bacterium]